MRANLHDIQEALRKPRQRCYGSCHASQVSLQRAAEAYPSTGKEKESTGIILILFVSCMAHSLL